MSLDVRSRETSNGFDNVALKSVARLREGIRFSLDGSFRRKSGYGDRPELARIQIGIIMHGVIEMKAFVTANNGGNVYVLSAVS